jgi:type VII secretion protein EccB
VESRKDQVQAYFFVVGRLISALMHGRPDPHERPNRRLSLGITIGVLIALVVAGGFGLYGFFKPGGTRAWRTPGAIIVVKETGARYLLIHDQLRPVLNYTSARLAAGGSATVISVAAASLTGVAVGTPIGIPGAPDTLPRPDRLSRDAWTVCAETAEPDRPNRTALVIGSTPGRDLQASQGLLVTTADDTWHLVWQGRRYRLAGPDVAVALGYGTVAPVPVTPAWLNPIPPGRDLAFVKVAGLGGRGPAVGGRPGTVGQVYQASNAAIGSDEMYVLRSDGLVRLSRTAAALMLADPAVRQAYAGGPASPIPIGVDEAASVVVRGDAGFVDGYPPAPPSQVNALDGMGACVRHRPVRGGVVVSTTAVRLGSSGFGAALSGPASAGGGIADDVLIAAGTGVLARVRPTPGAPPGALHLVSEFGVKFPIADDAALQALGYEGVVPVDLPSELLALLPTGPLLSQAAALASQSPSR